MEPVFRPASEAELCAVMTWALGESVPLELVGHGTKRGYGRPLRTERLLDMSGFSGITLYEPAELVLEAKAGTPLAEIERAVAAEGQMLAFEPADWGPLYGVMPGQATLGGVVACNLSGPRRTTAGAARDHVLGFSAVSGLGESFKAGGRVVKNVTGYDLSKLLTGSHGTLAALTTVTIKVLPAPAETRTLALLGLDDRAALGFFGAVARAGVDGSGLAHLPLAAALRISLDEVAREGTAVTAIRLEGTRTAVEERMAELHRLAAAKGAVAILDRDRSLAFWTSLRDVGPFVADHGTNALWRVSVPPASGAAVVAALAAGRSIEHFFDWGGGLVWISTPLADDGGVAAVRTAAASVGGHATLVRAPADLRAAIPVFEPEAPVLAALTRRVKESFDPRSILNPGRMYPGV